MTLELKGGPMDGHIVEETVCSNRILVPFMFPWAEGHYIYDGEGCFIGMREVDNS